jgi:hypothetical protein
MAKTVHSRGNTRPKALPKKKVTVPKEEFDKVLGTLIQTPPIKRKIGK